MEDRDIIIIVAFCLVAGFILGLALGNINELENGCIVHNDKIYCEVVNE